MPEEERFRILFEEHYHRVLGYALRRTDRREDAEDVVAETFTIAWRRLAEIPSGEGTRAWLYGVARRVLANQRRGSLRRVRLIERLKEMPAAGRTEVDLEHAETIADSFDGLREQDREVLALLCWEELTPAEIAVALGCSPGAARKRVHRARARFMRHLAEDQQPAHCLAQIPDQQRRTP
jgi:RNA polymerase sigma factor (sigma-70 family)